MLERMLSEGNTHPLLVGMKTCAATVEISVAVSQETAPMTQQFHSWEYTQKLPYHTTKGFVQLCS